MMKALFILLMPFYLMVLVGCGDAKEKQKQESKQKQDTSTVQAEAEDAVPVVVNGIQLTERERELLNRPELAYWNPDQATTDDQYIQDTVDYVILQQKLNPDLLSDDENQDVFYVYLKEGDDVVLRIGHYFDQIVDNKVFLKAGECKSIPKSLAQDVQIYLASNPFLGDSRKKDICDKLDQNRTPLADHLKCKPTNYVFTVSNLNWWIYGDYDFTLSEEITEEEKENCQPFSY